jgi:hypothetical protein
VKTLIIIVVGLAAYSVGAVQTRRRSAAFYYEVATPLEVVVVAVMLLLIASLPRPLGMAGFCALCAAVMFTFAAVFARLTRKSGPSPSAGTREFEESGTCPDAGLWKRWLHFSRSVIDYEFRLLLVASYLLIVAPLALASRTGADRQAKADPGSNWFLRADKPTLESARRQF